MCENVWASLLSRGIKQCQCCERKDEAGGLDHAAYYHLRGAVRLSHTLFSFSFPPFAKCMYSYHTQNIKPCPPLNIEPISCEHADSRAHKRLRRKNRHSRAHVQLAKVCIWALTSVSGRLKINAPRATSLTLIMGKVMTL